MEEMRDGELERAGRGEGAAASRGEPEGSEGRRGAASSEEEEVRRRAYERYLSRGDGPGSEEEDWLAAEREVRGPRPESAADAPEDGEVARGTSDGRSRGRR